MPPEPAKPNDAQEIAAKVPPSAAGMDGLHDQADEMMSEKLVNEIEMLGEEKAAGFHPPGHSEISAGMRYLHSSRTISQLVTDRNRAVGIYLAVASLLVTASCALVNASPSRERELIIPLAIIQKWCLPITFAVLAALAVLVAFLLIRTRAGLIYEVAKMNALLGLPIGRVQRIGWLSIFTILQTIISLAGGCSTALFTAFMLHLSDRHTNAAWPAILIGITVTALLMFLYVATVRYITSEKRLQGIGK
jgi:MFS family permease